MNFITALWPACCSAVGHQHCAGLLARTGPLVFHVIQAGVVVVCELV